MHILLKYKDRRIWKRYLYPPIRNNIHNSKKVRANVHGGMNG